MEPLTLKQAEQAYRRMQEDYRADRHEFDGFKTYDAWLWDQLARKQWEDSRGQESL